MYNNHITIMRSRPYTFTDITDICSKHLKNVKSRNVKPKNFKPINVKSINVKAYKHPRIKTSSLKTSRAICFAACYKCIIEFYKYPYYNRKILPDYLFITPQYRNISAVDI